MFIPPIYSFTKNIAISLQQIENLKSQLDLIKTDKILEKYSRQKSLLKSSLYSARIEGNTNSLLELENQNWQTSKQKQKIEIANLYKALEYIIQKNWNKNLTISDLKNIHSLVMKNLSSEFGYLRGEPSAIYNQAGIAVYICPLPHETKPLLKQLLDYINANSEVIIPIKTALIHYIFEKIHPFLDGNGRVGRLLIHLCLKKDNYDFMGLAPIEEFLDNNRQDYYDLLSQNKKDQTEFIEFFLECLTFGLQKAINEKIENQEKIINPDNFLAPRRYEILQIIKDHKFVSFNFIKRRFFKIPDRTLRYDLNQLVQKKFIIKRGVTRSVVYELNPNFNS